MNGHPSATNSYLFNGDFVDRGSWSTEIALVLYSYKWLYPDAFFINRGNHETDDMNKVYGFEGECRAKYNDRVFKLFSESFSALPLATLIGKRFLTLHGGLFSDDNITLDDIRSLNRHSQRQPGQQGLMMEMLWTDPQPTPGRGKSKRGVGLQFGPDVTKRFCEKNGLEAIIRSHEVRMEGYDVEHDGRCITGGCQARLLSSAVHLSPRPLIDPSAPVFSAPKYCDSTENKGAYITIGPDYKLEYHKFDAVPHPDIKPMVRSRRHPAISDVSNLIPRYPWTPPLTRSRHRPRCIHRHTRPSHYPCYPELDTPRTQIKQPNTNPIQTQANQTKPNQSATRRSSDE